MIDALCSGKVIGQRISIGNKQEQRFRDQSRKIFGIAESDAGNEDQCRKNVRIRITKCGYPLWTLSYLPTDVYTVPQEEAVKVIDAYQSFISNEGDQSILMEQVVSSFKGPQGKALQKWLMDSFGNKEILNEGMQNFIATKSPETASACTQYNFTVAEMFTMFRQELQEEIWQWRADEVAQRLDILCLDMKLVGIVNSANGESAKSVEKIRETLNAILRNVKVPVCVFEKVKVAWLPTLQDAINISINAWPGLSIEQKQNLVSRFESDLSTVLEILHSPIEPFIQYLNNNGLQADLDEIRDILGKLPLNSYNQSEDSFLATVKREFSKLAYNKLVAEVKVRWEQISGKTSVAAWEKVNGLPIAWLYPEFEDTFGVLMDIERNFHCDHGKLEMACSELNSRDFADLQNTDKINDCLLEHIAVGSKDILLAHIEILKQYLRENYNHPIGSYRK